MLAAALVACGLPTAGEFASGSATAAPDVSDARVVDPRDSSIAEDVAIVTPPSDAAADTTTSPPVTNLLPENNSDFEAPCSNDNGSYLASLEQSQVERSGQFSCEVCRAPDQPGAGGWSIDNGLSAMPVPGQEYRATAWVRRPPGSPDALGVRIALRTQTEGYDQVEWQGSDKVTLTDEWQLLSVTLAVTESAPRIDTYVFADNQDGLTTPCFLIDDYVAWRTK